MFLETFLIYCIRVSHGILERRLSASFDRVLPMKLNSILVVLVLRFCLLYFFLFELLYSSTGDTRSSYFHICSSYISGKIFPSGIASDSYKKAVESAIEKLRNEVANHCGGDPPIMSEQLS